MPCDLAPDYVRSIAPYQPGKPISELVRELGLEESDIVKLASNENPLGASPHAVAAMHAALKDVARYPDGNGFALKDAISAKYGVRHAQIVLGNGSNDVLELAARAFLAPGAEAVMSQHAFAVYPLVTQAMGAICVTAPARDFAHDLAAMRRAVTERTRLVFVANPNNPTGTLQGRAEVRAFLQDLPNSVLLVLDEAYDEYLPDELKADSIGWLEAVPQPGRHPHPVQSLRVGRAARGLRAGKSRRGGHPQPRAAAVQRQQRGAGSGGGGAGRRRFFAAQL